MENFIVSLTESFLVFYKRQPSPFSITAGGESFADQGTAEIRVAITTGFSSLGG